MVEVADNGCGYRQYKAKIFEPVFFPPKERGQVWGLLFVTSIIDDHHGQISILDNHPEGTIVRFVIPVPKERRRQEFMRRLILIVDDEESIRKSR